jgi:hypothetical protein
MAISANYAVPVYVNGYACNNCTQVAEAKQGVDPADPKAGPYGVDASSNAAQGNANPSAAGAQQSPAVIFGGVLANPSSTTSAATGQPSPPQGVPGAPGPWIQPSGSAGLLNISV